MAVGDTGDGGVTDLAEVGETAVHDTGNEGV